VVVESDEPLQPARTAALTDRKLRDAVGALGGTPYRLGELRSELQAGVFLPVGAFKGLRRRGVAELDRRRLAGRRRVPRAGVGSRPSSLPAGEPRPPEPLALAASLVATAQPFTVLRLRQGDEPIDTRHATALCLDPSLDDESEALGAALERFRAAGWPTVRCRPPEILYDADLARWQAVAALPWDAVYARHVAHLETVAPIILEYPLQGLNAETAVRIGRPGAGLLASSPAPVAVVAGPESSLEEIVGLAAALRAGSVESDERSGGASRHAAAASAATSATTTTAATRHGLAIAVEVLAFGRQQLLVSRDELGRAEGLVEPRRGEPTALSLVDAKEFVFPVSVAPGLTRIYNARVTNLAPSVPDLLAAGVTGFIVEQRDLSRDEGAAFRARGLQGLAAFAGRERSTTGHLFRGVS